MAKLPAEIETCRIHADTTLDKMGYVLAALAKMELHNIGYELLTTVHRFKEKTVHDVSHEAFAVEWIKDHPSFKIVEMVRHFEAHGRNKQGCYTAVRRLVEDGSLVREEKAGCYRVAMLALPKPSRTASHPPAKAAAPSAEAAPGTEAAMTNREFIWHIIGRRKSFAVREITEAFHAAGRAASSMTAVVSKMVSAKELKRTGEGEYAVLGRKRQATRSGNARAANVNGPRYAVSNRQFILDRIKGRKQVGVKEMEEVFVADKRNPRSVSAVFAALAHANPPLLTKAGPDTPGLYLVTRPGPAAAANGHDASEAH